MNRFSTLASLLTSLTIVASCGQLIGLSEFEKGEEEAEGGQGASGGNGGATGGTSGKGGGTSGGKGGTSGGKGGVGGGGKGGTTGGTVSEGGDGGSPEGGVGGSTGGNAGNGGSSAVGGDSGTSGTSGTGGTSGAGGTAGTAGGNGCVEITPGVAVAMAVDPDPTFRNVVYDYAIDEQLGSSFDDVLGIQVYQGTGLDGQLTGTFTLGTGIDDNYSSCARCILIERDVTMIGNAGDTRFYATSGTLVIDAASEHMYGRPIMTMDDVTLIEVTIDADTYVSTPVADGECYHISNFSFALPTAGWTCDDSTWGDNFCTCGCGARDLECTSPASDVCTDCAVTGSCADSCLDIAADNNATCGPGGMEGWTCGVADYGDGYCDCGCGVLDVDCGGGTGSYCDYCAAAGSCSDNACAGIDVTQNWLCTSNPWTCDLLWYGDGAFCDCGCNIVDADCSSQTAVCDYCDNPGGCSLTCDDIDPTDNSQCL